MSMTHILAKVGDAAAGGVGALSTGEALMAAPVLNRPDWLAKMGYTIAEAIDRVGAEWTAIIPQVARQFENEQARKVDADKAAQDALALAAARREPGSDEIDCAATLVTTGCALGYRDASFTFDLLPYGSKRSIRVRMRVRPEDGEPIAAHLREVHELAWRRHAPLDVQPGETRPQWLER